MNVKAAANHPAPSPKTYCKEQGKKSSWLQVNPQSKCWEGCYFYLSLFFPLHWLNVEGNLNGDLKIWWPRRQQERWKAIGLISQTTTLHVPSRFFQGHPVTVFCKTSVRRRKYCLGFFFACGRLKISWGAFRSCTIFEAYLNKFPTIFQSLLCHISLLRLSCFRRKKET